MEEEKWREKILKVRLNALPNLPCCSHIIVDNDTWIE
jgi:hypothetical protein